MLEKLKASETKELVQQEVQDLTKGKDQCKDEFDVKVAQLQVRLCSALKLCCFQYRRETSSFLFRPGPNPSAWPAAAGFGGRAEESPGGAEGAASEDGRAVQEIQGKGAIWKWRLHQ